jgi:putative pyruvate formate lyase activating enzyme
MGEALAVDELAERVMQMIKAHSVHNVNFVTPDHFFPHVFRLIFLLRRKGFDLPIVFNTSGYQSISMLKMAEPFVDIYLPDFKYADPSLAARFSKCKDYSDVALRAISEMILQKGFLDSVESASLLARKGVLVRHLILPGYTENSINVLTTLYLEFGARLPLSLMSQYTPVRHHQEESMNRPVTSEEFQKVYEHAIDLGFQNLFVQFPGEGESRKPNEDPFLPDFRNSQPFTRKPHHD